MFEKLRMKRIQELMESVQPYIDQYYEKPLPPVSLFDPSSGVKFSLRATTKPKLEEGEKGAEEPFSLIPPDWLMDQVENHTFANKLSDYIAQKGMRDPAVYKAANMDRRLFSKIMTDYGYQPSKDSVLALAFALKLTPDEANDLLEGAGYTLSHSIRRDVVIEYFFRSKIYRLTDINIVLDQLGLKMIGRQNVG